MSVEAICSMPVADFAEQGCHLWLWTTNAHLRSGYEVMERWGFHHLAPIVWVKPSGLGAYVIHRAQTCLFGYRDKCLFERKRFFPNVVFANVSRAHSRKPEAFRRLVEDVSEAPRLELFAREKAPGWDVWGNEVENDVDIETEGNYILDCHSEISGL
jgi:N6-adenosine-specific RNA methylase IME4